MDISKMTILWATQSNEWTSWAGFSIEGMLNYPNNIGVNTKPAEAIVIVEIPKSAGQGSGSMLGEETVKFKVSIKSNRWYYSGLELPHFPYKP